MQATNMGTLLIPLSPVVMGAGRVGRHHKAIPMICGHHRLDPGSGIASGWGPMENLLH